MQAAKQAIMQIEVINGEFLVDAALLAALLDIAPAQVPALMRAQAITSLCERGVDAHAGEYRLSFFYKNRRARLSVDATGQVLRRSVLDLGPHAKPRTLHARGHDSLSRP